jgi:phosphate transport system permease protein
MLERREWGNFFGYLVAVREGDQVVAEGEAAFSALRRRGWPVQGTGRCRTVHMERYDIGRINFAIEQERLEQRRIELSDRLSDDEKAERIAQSEAEVARLNAEYQELFNELIELRASGRRDSLVARTSDGREVTINLGDVVRATRANTMNVPQKIASTVRVSGHS